MSDPKEVVDSLRKESAAKVAEAARLEAMNAEYPNLRRYVGRWGKVAFYTKDVNGKVVSFDMRHNCGCCSDSPLEIWPYLETPHGKVYSDPPSFQVGERSSYGGDRPYSGWDTKMSSAGIPEPIIAEVRAHFEQCAEDARLAIASEYGDG